MDKKKKDLIERATVRFPRLNGQGVVIRGGFILTAAHVIGWTSNGDMTLSPEYFYETVEVAGVNIRATVRALEPCSDIAFLGEPDNQSERDEALAFDEAISAIEGVSLHTRDLPLGTEVQVHVFSHLGEWIEAEACQWRQGARSLAITSKFQIPSGTSGGPVVTDDGELIGVVSQSSEVNAAGEMCTGTVFRADLALPVWVMKSISEKQ